VIARSIVAGLVGALVLSACGGGSHGTGSAPASGSASARKPDSSVAITVKYPTNLVRGSKTRATRHSHRAPKFIDPGDGTTIPIIDIVSTDIYGASSQLCVAAAPGGDGTQTIAAVPMYSEGGSLSIIEYASGTAGVGDACVGNAPELAKTQYTTYSSFPGGTDVAFSSIFSQPVTLDGLAGAILYQYEGGESGWSVIGGDDFEGELCTNESTTIDFLEADSNDVGVGQSASSAGPSSTLTPGFPAVTISNVTVSGASVTIGSGSVPGSITIGPIPTNASVNFTINAIDYFGLGVSTNETATAAGACGYDGTL
jgi:hypothetical protein